MKIIQPLFAALVLAITASTAQAFIPPYHVDNEGDDKGGYYGSVTFKASGSCGFRAVNYKNAWLGSLFDSANEPVGWGIITDSGQLLVLEEDFARIKLSENRETGVGKDISYSDMVGIELINFITDHSGCSIESIAPNTNSRTTIKWDAFKGKERVNMRANYSGFEQEVCQDRETTKQCRADKFSGSITFKGDWSLPH